MRKNQRYNEAALSLVNQFNLRGFGPRSDVSLQRKVQRNPRSYCDIYMSVRY